jgi:hypothetical protein
MAAGKILTPWARQMRAESERQQMMCLNNAGCDTVRPLGPVRLNSRRSSVLYLNTRSLACSLEHRAA